ncbi:unnamed protein product, partial [Mesorhabditis belari]|uniref:Fungal lipase-like domain-containing protein n=1 Tax=Mesorhabditis belari TaxID=2138241 RepID=A0AAF3F2V8_9BILA
MKYFSFALLILAVNCANRTYSDDDARKIFYPLAASAYGNPKDCVSKWLGGQVIRQITIPCDVFSDDTCSGYTAIAPDKRLIAVVFRGTTTDEQLIAEIDETLHKKVQLGKGNVDQYFYEGFQKIWNAGMKDDFLSQRSRYPNYNIVVTGHSLGGAMATIAANFLKINYDLDLQLMTFGEPRVGDQAFADDHDARFGSSTFRVTHHNDIGPHIPPQFVNFQHHTTEIWYNNDMTTADYSTCQGQEDPLCSDQVPLSKYNITEHRLYFGVNLDDWVSSGCQKAL